MVDIWSGSGDSAGLLHHLHESNEWFEYKFEQQFESGGPDPHVKAREEYSRAWLGYVNEVRRKLEKHYKEEYDRVMAERAKYRQSRPDPEAASSCCNPSLPSFHAHPVILLRTFEESKIAFPQSTPILTPKIHPLTSVRTTLYAIHQRKYISTQNGQMSDCPHNHIQDSGLQAFREIIREKTDGGKTIVDFLSDAAEGNLPKFEPHHRIQASEILVRYGFKGADEPAKQHNDSQPKPVPSSVEGTPSANTVVGAPPARPL